MAQVGGVAEGAVAPASTLTFLFADVEGSTRLLQRLGEGYAGVLERIVGIVRAAVVQSGGHEQLVEGDGYFATFDTATDAVAAAVAAQQQLAAADWPEDLPVRVRMGMHTGQAQQRADGYVGLDVHRAARIADAAHGGQVVLSQAVLVLAQRALPDGVTARDLGSLRLRDLAEPEHLFQLVISGLVADFPPLRTLDSTPNNLPTQLTTFIGREREVDELVAALRRFRLVTVTGPGGTGKTRTVLQAAACAAADHRDGAWFVPLAEIRDATFVPSAIVQALRLRESGSADPSAQLREHLRDLDLLLVLDNFEQVLASAPLVSDVLRSAPGVRIVVTSRAPLHVSGEQELALPPLPVPDASADTTPESLSHYEAVTLFIERARSVKSDFAVTAANAPAIAEICHRLDGLPLAIELAAARIKLLPPEAMLARLRGGLIDVGIGPRDLPDRQQTLRAAIAWSYDLLAPDRRRTLRALSVFDGGWSLADAEAVCGGDIFEELSSLVDHSLVREVDVDGDARFDMLETIREFAREQLDAADEGPAARAAHADRYLALAEESAPHLLGRDQLRHTARLNRERTNFRATLDTFIATGGTEGALRLCNALWRFWQKVAVQEGGAQIERVLALPDVEAHPEALSATLEAAGGMAYWRGQMESARPHYERALAIERRLGRPAGLANALYNMSFTDSLRAQPDEALALQQQALDLYTAIGDEAGIMTVHWGMGVATYFAERLPDARHHFAESLRRARQRDDFFTIGWSLHMIGSVDLLEGEHGHAREVLTEALQMFAAAGDVSAVTLLLGDFAELALALGQPARHAQLSGASTALQQLTGSELARVSGELIGRTQLGRERFTEAWEAGLAMSMAEAVSYALEDSAGATDAAAASARSGAGRG